MYCTINLNEEKNGIELIFDKKPSYAVISEMKEKGFRWHNAKKLWYAKQSDERLAFANKLNADHPDKNTPENAEPSMPLMTRSDLEAGDIIKKANGVPMFITEVTDNAVYYEALNGWKHAFKEETFPAVKVTDPNEISKLLKKKEERTKASEEELDELKSILSPQKHLLNRIADHYKKIGSVPIHKLSDVSLLNREGNGYFEDLNVYVKCYQDSIQITDLENAQKKGKECIRYSIYPDRYSENTPDNVFIYLHNELNIKTVKELVEALFNNRPLDDLTVDTTDLKGVQVFSPFVEQKPIKTPKKWTKTHFQNALMSGQIFLGTLDSRYTDDYAYDYAYNYGQGRSIDLIATAADVVDDSFWSHGTSIRASEPDKDGVITLDYGDYSTSKTFLFKESCTLAEAIERQADFLAEKDRKNQEMLNKVIVISPDMINKNSFYSITFLEQDCNTNLYSEKTELWQGSKILSELDWDLKKFTKLEFFELIPDRLYEVGNFYNRLPESIKDERIIDMGNWKKLVSGKALSELTAEGFVFHNLREGSINTFKQAQDECTRFMSGQSMWILGGDAERTNYKDSFTKLVAEELRVSIHQTLGPLDSETILQGMPKPTPEEIAEHEKEKPSLDSIIGAAEKQKTEKIENKEPEQKLRSSAPVFRFQADR